MKQQIHPVHPAERPSRDVRYGMTVIDGAGSVAHRQTLTNHVLSRLWVGLRDDERGVLSGVRDALEDAVQKSNNGAEPELRGLRLAE